MNLAELLEVFTAAGSVATALGVGLSVWQVWLIKKQAIIQFEDDMAREYRELSNRLPAKAILGEALSDEEYLRALDEFIHYVDLCNEQIFLRKRGRISAKTWVNWCVGIESNLSQPAFARAWADIKTRSKNFRELRQLEFEKFRRDPVTWKVASPDDPARP